MVDMPLPQTLTGFLAMKVARSAVSRTKRETKEGNRALAVLNATIRLVTQLAGFLFLTWAGFSFNMQAGLIVAGISCFVFSWLITRETPTAEPMEVRRAPDMRTGR